MLPVSYVFVTEKRSGNGGKTEVAQNLLHGLNLQVRACLFDDNLEVAEEFCNAGPSHPAVCHCIDVTLLRKLFHCK